jgi:hypothetical protein
MEISRRDLIVSVMAGVALSTASAAALLEFLKTQNLT